MDIKEILKRAGNGSRLARGIGLKGHSSPYGWTRVPLKHVKKVSDLTGIPKHVLAPEFFDVPLTPEQIEKSAEQKANIASSNASMQGAHA